MLSERLASLEYSRQFNKLAMYSPYDYQTRFHHLKGESGQLAKARGLMAANQIGKTTCGGYETAIHATGLYPDWWKGSIIVPKLIVCSGKNSYKTRDLIQKELLGTDNRESPDVGTGAIPKHLIVGGERKPGIPGAAEKIYVRHRLGHTVTILLLGYEDGPGKFMGERIDFGWCDEEPPLEIWSQYVRGTIATDGRLIITFTPEDGMTQVVYKFVHECPDSWALMKADWDDAPHLSEERKKELLASLMPHEREMRSKGEPVVGESMVFPITDDALSVDPILIPDHWPQIIGIDFGGDHPFAVVKLAIDPDGKRKKAYVIHAEKHRRLTISQEASIVKGMGGDKIPVAWPHDGNKYDKASGKTIADLYREEGVNMLPNHFTNPPEPGKEEGTGGNGIEAGIKKMYWAMTEGRFGVFSHLREWFKEKGAYHRKSTNDGGVKIVPLNDDLMSATRYAYMSALDNDDRIRHAKTNSDKINFFKTITYDNSIFR